MRFRPSITAVLLAGVFAVVTLAAGPSGTWRWEHPDPENQQLVKDVLTIEVDDGEVSGTYQMIGGGAAGTYKVNNGKLAGDTFTWNFDLPVGGGQTLNISYAGKITGGAIAGTVKLGELGEFLGLPSKTLPLRTLQERGVGSTRIRKTNRWLRTH